MYFYSGWKAEAGTQFVFYALYTHWSQDATTQHCLEVIETLMDFRVISRDFISK